MSWQSTRIVCFILDSSIANTRTSDSSGTVLLGDSCHATLPYVGQGANQAIEDAIVLAECLEQHTDSPQEAFAAYFSRRSRRTRRIARMANWMDKLHHAQNPLANMLREYRVKVITSGNRMAQLMEK